MKIFLYLSLIKIYFSLDFNPLPKENGILNSQYAHNTTNNLYFIFEHFRHGARSPCNGGFIDYKDDLGGKWENYGSLTKLGAKQHYLLGLRNRKYYDGFISREYNSNEIRVYCSNYNRTMMSAQAQLLGFYNKIDFKNIQKNDDIIGEEKISNKVNLQGIIPPINLFLNMQEDKQNFEIAFREKFKCPFLKEMIEVKWIICVEIIYDSHRIPFHLMFIQQFYAFHDLDKGWLSLSVSPIFVMKLLRAVDRHSD